MLPVMDEDQAVTADASPGPSENVGKKILAGGTWRVIAFAFAALLGVVMTAVVSRQIGPADFALFTTAMSLVTIALSLSDVGLLTLGVREYASRPPEERAVSQRALIGLRLITSLITSAGIVLFASYKGYPQDVVWGLVAAGVGICALSLAISYSVPLQATYRLGQVAALEAGRQALQMTLMIVFALTFANVGWLMAAYLPTGVVLAVVAGVLSRKLSPITPSFDLTVMRGLLVAAGAYSFTAAVGANYPFVVQIVTNSVLTAHESGMFSLAFRVFVVGMTAFSAAVGGAFALLVTTVTQDDRERLAFAGRRLSQVALLAGVGSAVGMVTGAGFVVALLGGADFGDAIPVVAVIGLGLPGTFVTLVSTMLLLADHHYFALIVRSASGALASVVVTWLLADLYGPVGAAAGMVIGEYVLAIGYVHKVRQVEPAALPAFVWVLAVMAVGAVACSAALLPIPSLFCAAVGLAFYLALMLVFRLVPPELLNPIRSRLSRAS